MRWKLLLLLFVSLIALNHCELNKHPFHREITDYMQDLPLKSQFKIWTYMFRRPYSLNSEQGLERYKIFKKNMKMITTSNSNNSEYILGLGPFTDLTFEEFVSFMSNNQFNKTSTDEKVDTEVERSKWEKKTNNNHNESPDWSAIWPHVLDQGESMSCWAFTTTAIIEAANYLNKNAMEYLSPQSLIDCNQDGWHNASCNGGRLHFSFNYLKWNGLAKYQDYPYTAVCGKCSFYQRNDCSTKEGEARFITPYVKISEFRACDIDFGYPNCSPEIIKEAIKFGPFGTGIQITPEIQHYRGGVINPTCHTLNHAVVAVQVTNEYIKFRNTWSPSWGENGYGRVKFVKNGNYTACGLADSAYQVLNTALIYNNDYH